MEFCLEQILLTIDIDYSPGDRFNKISYRKYNDIVTRVVAIGFTILVNRFNNALVNVLVNRSRNLRFLYCTFGFLWGYIQTVNIR